MSADRLTPRELEVARLVAEGYTCHEIAEQLARSVWTVRGVVQRIALKIDGRGPPALRITRWYYRNQEAA